MLKYIASLCLAMTASVSTAADRWMSIPPAPPMPTAEASGMADVNGISMYFATYGSGDGTPILMIHGGLAHADIWAAEVAVLSQTHRVIVADTRGHGRSTNDGSAYSYDLLAQDYLALLDKLGIEKVHLVGWSDGANIGYTISVSHPERLASHFAHAGNVTLDGIDPAVETNEVFGAYIGMMAADYARLSATPDGFDDFLGGIVAMWGTEKPGAFEALAATNVPTLVVQSRYDEAILMAHARKIADTIPGADLLVLEDVSHFAAFQAPAEYAAAVEAWVKSVEAN